MDIDWMVIGFEVLNFGVLVVLLRRFLFRPVQEAIQTRREAIERDRRELEEREAVATGLREEYEARLQEIEKQARARLGAAEADGRSKAEALVRDGREEARRLVAGAEEQTSAARRRALEQLRLEILSLACDAATRVVKNMDAPTVACAYARRAAHGFAEVFSGGTMPDVVDAVTGDDADPDQIAKELRAVLGPRVRVNLAVDPGIVAGVRLRANGHEIEASASASLRRWYEQQLAADDTAMPSESAA